MKIKEFLEIIGVTKDIRRRWRIIGKDIKLILRALFGIKPVAGEGDKNNKPLPYKKFKKVRKRAIGHINSINRKTHRRILRKTRKAKWSRAVKKMVKFSWFR